VFAIRPRRLGAVLLLTCAGLARAASLDAVLAQAEQVRSADPPKLHALLSELDARAREATPLQREHVQLLQAYDALFAGDYDTALARSRTLAASARDLEVRYRANLFVANVSAVTGDYLGGVQYLERALALDTGALSPAARDAGRIVAATLYNEFEQYDLALRFSEEALAGPLPARARCAARHNRLQALQALGRGVDANEVSRAIADCRAIGEAIAVGLMQLTQARQWDAEGRHADALRALDAALPTARRTGYTTLIAMLQSLRADQRLHTGDLTGADRDAREVLAVRGDRIGWRPRILADQVLYHVAEQRQQPGEALAYYKASVEGERARLAQLRARESTYQIGQQELRRSTASLQRLSGQNQTLRLREEVAQRAAWNFRLAAALLAVVALFAALWISRARRTHRVLRRLAETDTLTGLGNRRHFRACAERVLADCRARGQPAALVLFDLDHFKQINDECGHAVGDRVLAAVANAVTRMVPEALHGRLGGEEFAFLVRNCDADCAGAIAERCREVIHAIDQAAGRVPVSASLGVAATAQAGYDFEALVSLADSAMYAAKAAGRDRVVVASVPA
jgi:diguanylate cyclase (GGDEF)-like protein